MAYGIGTSTASSGGGGGGGVFAQFGQGINQAMEEEEMAESRSKIQVKEMSVKDARNMVEKILKTDIVPFLWGPPGVGKSTLVRDICAAYEWELIDLRLSLLNPVDLRGLPVVNKKTKIANWYPPSFLPRLNHPRVGVLFLDEINLAPLSVQAAAYQLILDKRVGEYQFPRHWKIIAAGNREIDKANVYKISAPLANRFVHFTVQPNFSEWKDWAQKEAGLRQEIIDFLLLRPSLLLQMPSDSQKAFPSPRTWEFASQLINAFDYNEDDGVDTELKQLIIGTIGENVGKEFIAFLQDYKIKSISKKVEDFIKTGKIDMPKALSPRYALIRAVYHARRSGELDKKKWESFFRDKLSAEEKKTIETFEKEHDDTLERKYAQLREREAEEVDDSETEG